MSEKKRLDVLLAEDNYFPSRSKAKRAIMAGQVYVNNELIDKAGTRVEVDDNIKIKGNELPYVSRGGLKLEKALKVFSVEPEDRTVIDIGASTGGFTDCLLQQGADEVYAIDVGYGQLAWKLRQDKRVNVIERTNFRYLTPEELPVKVSLIVTDVSFISLRLIIPPALQFLQADGDIIALIKPQFEAGPERIGKNGVVKDKSVHKDIIKELSDFFVEKNLTLKGLNFSPITGASSKNIEFLVHLRKISVGGNNLNEWYKKINKVVNDAHRELERG